MASPTGFEPVTSFLEGKCSVHLSYREVSLLINNWNRITLKVIVFQMLIEILDYFFMSSFWTTKKTNGTLLPETIWSTMPKLYSVFFRTFRWTLFWNFTHDDVFWNGGDSEIRTHGRLPVARFQSWCINPLCHISWINWSEWWDLNSTTPCSQSKCATWLRYIPTFHITMLLY